MNKLVPKGSERSLPDLSFTTAIYMAFGQPGKEWLTAEEVVTFLSSTVKMPDESLWAGQIGPALRAQATRTDGNLMARESIHAAAYKVRDQCLLQKELDKSKDVIHKWLKPPNDIRQDHPTPPSPTDQTPGVCVQIFETKPIIDTNRPLTFPSSSQAIEVDSIDPPVDPNTVDPNLWMQFSCHQGRGDSTLEDPTKPQLSNYLLFGIALHINGNRWMDFEDIVREIRSIFPYYQRLEGEQLHSWRKYCKRSLGIKIRNEPGYFEQKDDSIEPKYRTGHLFPADLKKWRIRHGAKDSSQWMRDPGTFRRIVSEVMGEVAIVDSALIQNQMDQSANSSIHDSTSSFFSQDGEEEDGGNNEIKPTLQLAYMAGVICLYYGDGKYMLVEEIFNRMEELFPYYRGLSPAEKKSLKKRMTNSLTQLSKSQTARGKFVDRRDSDGRSSYKINARYFLKDFEPWLQKNKRKHWEKWTDTPGHFFTILGNVFGRSLDLVDSLATAPQSTPQPPANQSRIRALTAAGEPKVPVLIVMGLAVLSSTEKKLLSRDIKRAVVEILPYYQTNELALLNALKKHLYQACGKFGQIPTTAPDSNRPVGKFYLKDESEMREMAEQFLRENPNIQAVEYGLRNGDEFHKMVNGEYKPYEANLDPNLKVAKTVLRAKETPARVLVAARFPTTRSAAATETPQISQPTPIMPVLATAPAAPSDASTLHSSDSELEVEDEEVEDEEVEVHPYQLNFDWRKMISGSHPTFESLFPQLIQKKNFPIATSREEYLCLEKLYRKHNELIRETQGVPNWRNGFDREEKRRSGESKRQRNWDNSRGRRSRSHSYSRSRSRDRYRRSRHEYSRRSRSRDDSRDRRRRRSRSYDDYRRRSYDYYSPRQPDVIHCGPDMVVSHGQLYQKVSQPLQQPMYPPMPMMPYHPYAYMPPPQAYMAPHHMQQPAIHQPVHQQQAHQQQAQVMYPPPTPTVPTQMPAETPNRGEQPSLRGTTIRYRPIKREIEIVEINDDEADNIDPQMNGHARHAHRPAITANVQPIQYYDGEGMHVDHEETINARVSF